MSALLVAPLLLTGALGCSIAVPDRSVFAPGLSLGPNEGDWEVTVDGSRKITRGGRPLRSSGNFFFNVDSGASLPTFRLTGDQLFRSTPLRPDFSGQYVVQPSEGVSISVAEAEGPALGFQLPWAPREGRDGFTIVSKVPHAVGYWSSVSRRQVYVLAQYDEFGPVSLHVLDLDDGSWFEPVAFNGGFEQRGDDWAQLKSLDEFGVVETFTPCCACNDIEWVAFDAEGDTRPIAADPIVGDAGFDQRGNLVVTDFDSIIIFRVPDYKKEVVAQFTDDELSRALTVPSKCSEADGDCPGIPQAEVCGDEQTKLKFSGFSAKRVERGVLGPCECEQACADVDHWTLRVSSGRCVCYLGSLKRTVSKRGYVSGHNIGK